MNPDSKIHGVLKKKRKWNSTLFRIFMGSEMAEKQTTKKTYFVQALDRALDILECFSHEQQYLSLPQVTELTGLHRTTVTRILHHLTSRNVLKYDPESRHYQLGSKIVELGGIAISSISLRQVASDHLSRLRDDIGFTILLATKLENHYVFVDKQTGRSLISLSADIGWRRPLSFGIFGMVFLAYQSREIQEKILTEYPLKAYTSNSIVDKEQYFKELERIRKKGYLIEIERFHEDLGGICAPIRDYTGTVVGCLGTAINAARLHDVKGSKKLITRIQDTASAISADLGYSKSKKR